MRGGSIRRVASLKIKFKIHIKNYTIMATMYVTIRIDYDAPIETDMEAIAEMVCERANAHNHTIEDGVTIENVEMCGINE